MAPTSRRALPAAPIDRFLRPVSAFIGAESAGGLLLMGAAVAALILANSPLAEAFHHLWEFEVGLRLGAFSTTHTLHYWINDGLMAVFFFVVGLEIKREAMIGELASLRRAALPAAGALGGMIVPALLYAAFNLGGDGSAGWGIPMATDIAFALGVLILLGPRVPVSLKIFLTALAIVDDIGAVLVIALFYTAQIDWGMLAGGFALIALAAAANRMGVRQPITYLLIGVAVWVCFLASGVHATVAGVLMAMTIPSRTRIDTADFFERGQALLYAFDRAGADAPGVLTNAGQQEAIHGLEEACEAAQSPLQRIEHSLHGVVAFGIIPLFALSNAGVAIPRDAAGALLHPVTLGVILGLVLGKPIGITLFSWLAVRLRLAELPEGVRWGQLHVVSWLGGIGFTMSLFIGGLAFEDPALVDSAKVGILTASVIAGVCGWLLVRRWGISPARRSPRPAARSHAVAEESGSV